MTLEIDIVDRLHHREIPLTRGMVAIVDLEDYDWLMTMRWHANWQRTNYYAVNSRFQSMSRLITNAPRHLQVDHINKMTLDNRRENLRLVTNTENGLNRTNNTDGISYRGYSFSFPWRLRVRTGPYTRKHIGVYRTREDAEEALRVYTNS